MATRMKMLKLLQEMRGLANFTARRAARHPALFTLQIRSHLLKSTAGQRKRNVLIDMREPADIPHPVPIIYVDPPQHARSATADPI